MECRPAPPRRREHELRACGRVLPTSVERAQAQPPRNRPERARYKDELALVHSVRSAERGLLQALRTETRMPDFGCHCMGTDRAAEAAAALGHASHRHRPVDSLKLQCCR
jgi:hypothetical protein